jgi:hypothetical protein
MFLWQRTLNKVLLYILANKLWELISILQTSRDSYSPLPVIIVKALFKCEVDQCLLRHFRCIIRHSEQCWSAGALSYILGSQVEIVWIICGYALDHYTARVRIKQLRSELVRILHIVVSGSKVPCIDLLIGYYYH